MRREVLAFVPAARINAMPVGWMNRGTSEQVNQTLWWTLALLAVGALVILTVTYRLWITLFLVTFATRLAAWFVGWIGSYGTVCIAVLIGAWMIKKAIERKR